MRSDLRGFTCLRINNWLHFLYTGELAICCIDYHREEIFGDIRIQLIDDILQSQAYINLKKKLKEIIILRPPLYVNGARSLEINNVKSGGFQKYSSGCTGLDNRKWTEFKKNGFKPFEA